MGASSILQAARAGAEAVETVLKGSKRGASVLQGMRRAPRVVSAVGAGASRTARSKAMLPIIAGAFVAGGAKGTWEAINENPQGVATVNDMMQGSYTPLPQYTNSYRNSQYSYPSDPLAATGALMLATGKVARYKSGAL